MRLLVAEDDPRLRKTLVHIFEENKYSVDGVGSGEDALAYAMLEDYDGLVLDIMLPGMDGVSVLQKLRSKKNNTPALFLTARTEVADRVKGLDAGADDYLPKPFATAELLARVRAMLRRREQYSPDLLEFGGMALDRAARQAVWGRQVQTLSGREFQLLEMLMQNPRTILPTSRILAHIWGWDANVDTSVVWVHICNLRKKLAALGAPVEIRFVRGAGYALEEKR